MWRSDRRCVATGYPRQPGCRNTSKTSPLRRSVGRISADRILPVRLGATRSLFNGTKATEIPT
jgi:hypothetical protein